MGGLTIACVLRSGGDFTASWVDALRRGLNIWAPKGYRFVCLTDDPAVGIWGVPLKHPEWPGWWAKPHIFDPGLFRRGTRVLYLDLDTLVVGKLDDIGSYTGPLACLSDFYQGRKMIGSGVMAWTVGEHTERIYTDFVSQAERLISGAGRSDYFYRRYMADADRLQDLYPGQIVTLKPIDDSPDPKKHGAPKGARIVAGHGRPRLSDPAAGWAHGLWEDRTRGERRVA